jgi:plastocyanin
MLRAPVSAVSFMEGHKNPFWIRKIQDKEAKMQKSSIYTFIWLFAAISLGLILFSCGHGGSSSSEPATTTTVQVVDCATATAAATVTATASNTFTPGSVSVPVNGVVKWTTSSNVDHTVTSGTGGTADGKFNHTLNPGTTVCLQFTTAGSYSYYCIYHYSMGMVGSVTVQ